MKRIWVIYNRIQYGINEWFALALSDRLKQNGNDVRLIMREDLELPEGEGNVFKYEGKEIEPPDIAVVRIIDPWFTRRLEAFGVRTVNNSKVSKICNDKKRSYLLAKKAGVPFADFFEIGSHKGLHKGVEYPLVVKTVSGHGGKEVRLCRNENDVNEAVRAAGKEKLIAQKLVGDGKSGKDLRVYVLGGRIFKAVLRSSEIDF
ncbi:MAG: ATP-grasp domain-containing protein, partial [Clostridia bacterium]|nr:ATP-grasp domain-containing protein [Clostridia bacterium]